VWTWHRFRGLMAMVLTLFSEVGRDMSRWPTAAHFVSWLGLCPDNDISGGRVLWLGPAAATTATAHKISIIFYTMVKRQVEYDATIWAARDA
jgi:transposase